MKPAAPEDRPPREKFARARAELSAALIERDEEVDLALTALVAREHLLLVGPPGCAKSLLLDALMNWMGGRTFRILLTRFTTPEEVLGPISVRGLKEDVYRRVTTGKLPQAEGAFLDEIFKGSSAVLNILLKILNERTSEVGDGTTVKVPLRLAVGASNEWPAPESAKELAALFDRFLLRREVRPILTHAGRERLLWEADHTPALSTSVTAEEVDQAHEEARSLPFGDEAREALRQILGELAREGVRPGDRRQFKAVGVARAYAWLSGADEVEPGHLEVLSHVLWDSPEEQPRKVAEVVARVANPTGMKVNSLLLECEQILGGLDVKDLSQAATAAAKLQEVLRQFASLRGDPRADKARAYVAEQVRQIKLASIEAL